MLKEIKQDAIYNDTCSSCVDYTSQAAKIDLQSGGRVGSERAPSAVVIFQYEGLRNFPKFFSKFK